MKRFILLLITASLLIGHGYGGEDVEVWKDFVQSLQKGEVTADRIRPLHESLKAPLIGFLAEMRDKAAWEDWEAAPEVHRVGNKIHYLIPLTFDGEKSTYCFSFITKGKTWYFQHMEGITIRLDKVSSLPTSSFPDLPEEQKAWVREEIRVSEHVRLFNMLSKEEGRDSALDWFKDGAGYSLAARAWVPFVPEWKGFILYLCWEQSNLRGNKVALQELDKRKALVTMEPMYFKLYDQSGHLKQQISFEDYRAIFETVWKDRARAAGWDVKISYRNGIAVFRFARGR